MSGLRRNLYRAARDLGDVEAAARGPAPLARRIVRRQVYKHVGRGTRGLLRALGLGR